MPELKMRDLEDMVFIPFIKGNPSTTSPQMQAQPQEQLQGATSTVTQKATSPATENAKSPAKVPGMMPSPVVGPVPEKKEEGWDPAPKPGFNPSPVAVPSPAMAKKETFWDKTKTVMNTVGSTVKKGASWVGEKR